jgi:serine protease AprX
MKSKITLLFILIACSVFSQEQDAWVYFTGKPNAQSFLDNPLTMLTQRALDRRAAQNISLSIQDAPIEQSYIDQVDAATGITVKAKSKWLNCVHVRGTEVDINALLNLSFVQNLHFADNSLNLKTASNHTIVPVNKNMDVEVNYNYGTSANQVQMLNTHILHQQNYTGQGKMIAVLDSGFINVNTTAPFQRLYDNNLIVNTYNYVNRTTNVYDLHNHGTMTLSCMGGYVDGQLVGTAPDAQYLLYVTEDVSSENPVEESYWVEAAEEADRLGADVISTSLGYFGYDNTAYSHTYSDMTGNSAFASKGANIAFSKGIIIVASAGNNGSSTEPHINVPSEATNVVCVGAVDANEIKSNFSAIGPSFDGRIKPDVMAKGVSATVAYTSGAVGTASGTSFSCPIMAGSITSFWSAIPWATNQQVIDFYKQSCDRFSNPDNQYGYGIPDFQVALNNALSTIQNTTDNFYVYPNPTNDLINITLPTQYKNSTITIYDAIGQKVGVKYLSYSQNIVNLAHLQAGVYFYTISNENNTQSGKIVKR